MSAFKWQVATTKVRFGLEELLSPAAQVYFENLFSTRHVGRVIDFMLFQCKDFIDGAENPTDVEYRFRHVIELSIFAAWTNYRKGDKVKCVEIEFGWDVQKILTSVAFVAESGLSGFMPGTPEPGEGSARRLRQMLERVQVLADGLIVRHEPQTGRMQIIGFVTMDSADRIETPQYADLSRLPADVTEPEPEFVAPRAEELATPQDLSGADLAAFVADENASPPELPEDPLFETKFEKSLPAVPPGSEASQTLIKSAPIEDDESDERIKAGVSEKETSTVVKGGSAPGADNTTTTIKGSGAAESDDTATLVKSGPKGEKERVTLVKGGGRFDGAENREPMKVRAVEGGGVAGGSAASGTSGNSSKREKKLLDQIKSLNEEILGMRKERQRSAKVVGTEVEVKVNDTEAPGVAEISEEEHRLEISKLRAQFDAQLQNSKGNDASTREIAKEMMETVIRERTEIKLERRKITANLRKKEHEFKTKELALKESARAREEQINQKEAANEKLKDKISVLSGTLDKVRAQNAEANDRVELTHKLLTAEKLLEKASESSDRYQKRSEDAQKRANEEINHRTALQTESSRQKRQIDDLQRKLEDAVEACKKGSSTELVNVTEQRDKGLKVIEELKRQMRELQGKLVTASQSNKGATKDQAAGGKSNAVNEAEFKHKLELANNIAKSQKDELEKSKKRVEELKAQEARFRSEISKLQSDVARLQNEVKAAGLKAAGMKAAHLQAGTVAASGKPAKGK